MQLKLPIKETTAKVDEGATILVLGEKVYHKNWVHALAEGGGTMVFEGLPQFAVRVFPLNETFNRVQLIALGRQETLKSSLYMRTKKIIKKATDNSKQPQKEFEFKEGKEEVI